MSDLLEQLQQARNISVPLVYVRTYDPASMITRLLQSTVLLSSELQEEVPVVRWDLAAGLVALNEKGAAAIANAMPPGLGGGGQQPQGLQQQQMRQALQATTLPSNALAMFAGFPKDSVMFMLVLSPQDFFKDPGTVQRLFNLRDALKDDARMLFILGPHCELPAGIGRDFLVVHEPLPTREELEALVKLRSEGLISPDSDVPPLTDEQVGTAANSLLGLTPIEAETALGLSFKWDGLDFAELREQRYAKIDETPGLKVNREDERLERLKGLDGAVELLTPYFAPDFERRIGGIFYVDEVEKMFAGLGGDNTGTIDQFLAAFLKYMDKYKVLAALFLGLPGLGKSALSKALGHHFNLPTFEMNLDEMLDKYLGTSQQNIHRAFDTITLATGGCPLMLASSNSDAKLPSSFLRRFRIGRFFFPLPNRARKDQIWQVKLEQYGLPAQQLPDDEGWGGAEIDICCEKASLFRRPLLAVADSVIPISQTRPDEVVSMCAYAHNKYLDVATGKPFNNLAEEVAPVEVNGGRKFVVSKARGH